MADYTTCLVNGYRYIDIGNVGPLTWAEVTVTHRGEVDPTVRTGVGAVGGRHEVFVFSSIPLPDPGWYYGGYKEPRVIDWGLVRRALSDEFGLQEWPDFSFMISDTDWWMRKVLADVSTRAFLTNTVVVRMISDQLRRLQEKPITIARGIIARYQLPSSMKAEITLQDELGMRFSTAKEADQIPKRRITKDDFPNCGVTLVSSSAYNYVLAMDYNLKYGDDGTPEEITELEVHGEDGRFWVGAKFKFAGSGLMATTRTAPADLIAQMSARYGNDSNWNALRPQSPSGEYDCAYATDALLIEVCATFGAGTNWNALRPSGAGGNLPPPPPIPPPPQEEVVYTIESTGGDPGWPRKDTTHITISPGLKNPTSGGTRLVEIPSFEVQPSLGLPVPIVYGVITDTLVNEPDAGDGQGPCIYVGDKTINGRIWREFLWAGHACAGYWGGVPFVEIYVGNTPVDMVKHAVADDVLIPGTYRWNDAGLGPHTYRDYNGRRYTVFYMKGAAGDRAIGIAQDTVDWISNTVAIDGAGCGAHADGSDAEPIFDLPLQYRHCLQNWVYGDYQGGDQWLESPFYTDYFEDPNAPSARSQPKTGEEATTIVPQIDDASFDRVNAITKGRVGWDDVTGGGYRGDFVIGWTALDWQGSRIGGERISARDLIARFNQCCDTYSGNNNQMQFFICMIDDPPPGTVIPHITDNDIMKDSFSITPRFEELYNIVPFLHTQDYLNRETQGSTSTANFDKVETGWRSVETGIFDMRDALSIAEYGEFTAPVRKLYMLRGTNRPSDYPYYKRGTDTANDVMRRWLVRHKMMPYYVTLSLDYNAMKLELGDVVYLTAFQGLGGPR